MAVSRQSELTTQKHGDRISFCLTSKWSLSSFFVLSLLLNRYCKPYFFNTLFLILHHVCLLTELFFPVWTALYMLSLIYFDFFVFWLCVSINVRLLCNCLALYSSLERSSLIFPVKDKEPITNQNMRGKFWIICNAFFILLALMGNTKWATNPM